MATFHFSSLEDFAERGIEIMSEMVDDVGVEYHRLVHETYYEEAVARTPVAEARTPVAEGELKRSWVQRVGRRKVKNTPTRAAIKKSGKRFSEVGRYTSIGNSAAHANTIDLGRGVLSTGRVGGSLQAPRGMTRPAREKVEAMADQLGSEAVRRVESKR